MLRLFRSISRGRRQDNDTRRTWSPFASSPEQSRHRAVGQALYADEYEDNGEDDDGGEGEEDDNEEDYGQYSPRQPAANARDYFDGAEHYGEYGDEDGAEDDEDAVETPLLPIFSAAHLDRLPLYNITHAIRHLIVAKCETTLSWDQLRTPQISQFLVKPIQAQIRADHFNRATLCALIANCLQFQKEGQMNPANVGVCRTRAMISELLAMRLLREFSTRELIDSLSYDFDPLQGMSTDNNGGPGVSHASPPVNSVNQLRMQGRVARVSTIEIAIRAEAKRFLAHPVVVQHLEAIWAGNIVFHSEADHLHRKHRRSRQNATASRISAGYGTNELHSPSALPADAVLSKKAQGSRLTAKFAEPPLARRTVTLYNPREASLFKLSRLRVPRYRQVFNTFSFATMLALFVAVLADRNLDITALEVLFWFWSIGYMLDEIVGFTEQGFGLYILSFWNAIDLGILFLFGVYYCLRLYGVVLADEGKHKIAGVAYDVLASTAILLFPRLFSVLDHYKYFSQLLIAFRLMAQDLVAILVLIAISCSGFFVALSLSFAETRNANGVAYSLFQILMGFTPAVWDNWESYNILGKTIMVLFLTICHFLVVTILITVLTNSFMAIVKNAEEEHQFLFAINTISMVKSDALFSYVAPTNIIGWMLSPVRFLIPLRTFVRFNRTIIKISHFPILFAIFAYERMIMARRAYVPTDLIEQAPTHQKQPVAFSINKAPELYTPNARLREPSVISFNKDRALDEVFRRPFQGDTMRTTTREMEGDKHNSTNVDQWMQAAENEGGASPPLEQPRSVLERLEHRRPRFSRLPTNDRRKMMQNTRDFSTATKSIASDPDRRSANAPRWSIRIEEESSPLRNSVETLPQDTEADGDDEINEESEDNTTPAVGESAISLREKRHSADDSETELFQTPTGPNSPMLHLSHAARARLAQSPDMFKHAATPSRAQAAPRHSHTRQTSSGTILFAPQVSHNDKSSTNPIRASRPVDPKKTSSSDGAPLLPIGSALVGSVPGPRLPAKKPAPQPRARPVMPPRQKTAPNSKLGIKFLDMPPPKKRVPSFNARALDLASDLGDNKWGPSGGGIDAGGISGFPASFSEQFMRERDLQRREEEQRRRTEEEEKGMVNRIMLARMHTLEEGFREVLKEIKDLSHTATNSSRRESDGEPSLLLSRGKPLRPLKAELTSSSYQGQGGGGGNGGPGAGSGSGSGWQTPNHPNKTPIGRIAGNEKSKKASPRKTAARRYSKKGKENERTGSSSGGGGGGGSAGLKSGLSVGQPPFREELQDQHLREIFLREDQPPPPSQQNDDIFVADSPQSIESAFQLPHHADSSSNAAAAAAAASSAISRPAAATVATNRPGTAIRMENYLLGDEQLERSARED